MEIYLNGFDHSLHPMWQGLPLVLGGLGYGPGIWTKGFTCIQWTQIRVDIIIQRVGLQTYKGDITADFVLADNVILFQHRFHLKKNKH